MLCKRTAAAEARQQLFGLAAPLPGANVDELRSRNGTVYVKPDPSKSLSFNAACARIDVETPIIGRGSRAPNPAEPMMATFGAQAAEAEVDTQTGHGTDHLGRSRGSGRWSPAAYVLMQLRS